MYSSNWENQKGDAELALDILVVEFLVLRPFCRNLMTE
jgi:hypothetical protein